MKMKRNNYLYTTKLGETRCVDVTNVIVNNVIVVDAVVR